MRAVVTGVVLSGRIMRVLRLCIGLGAVVVCLATAAPAFAYVAPATDTTATPVVVQSWELTSSVPVVLSDEQVAALASAIASASAPATVSVPGTLTVNPWSTAGLPDGWLPVVVVGAVAIAGWGVGRAFSR